MGAIYIYSQLVAEQHTNGHDFTTSAQSKMLLNRTEFSIAADAANQRKFMVTDKTHHIQLQQFIQFKTQMQT